jgi:hypothetical protein
MATTTFTHRIWIAAVSAVEITTSHAAFPLERLEPAEGCYIGVSLGRGDTPERFGFRVGLQPAVHSKFFAFPLNAGTGRNLEGFLSQVRLAQGIAMVTLELPEGLSSVTDANCLEFAALCAEQETQGIRGIFVRFAHEMNGNWYAWGQQPILYKEKFRLLASQIHSRTGRTAMMWAPSYGGGYPFGSPRATPGTPDFAELDTDGDGAITQKDDMYEPYYPGDDVVDWVGLTLYHWGASWPWLENELPEPNNFAELLTGQYSGLNGDQRAVPDFYGRYCAAPTRAKPMAIAETAAFYNPHQGGVPELAIKRAWVDQVFNISGDTPEGVDVAQRFPNLKCVVWFDYYKLESDQGQWIDWRISRYAPVRSAYVRAMRTLRDGRPWFLTAQEIGVLQEPFSVTDVGIPSVLPITGSVTLSLYVQAESACELSVELLDGSQQRKASHREALEAGSRVITVSVEIDQPLVDGAAYHWTVCLAQPGSTDCALASYVGVPQVARAISPAIQIVAVPPVLASSSTNSVIKVAYATADEALVTVNLLDSQNRWFGGGTVKVARGAGLLDIPVPLQPHMASGNYVLELFLSAISDWPQPMTKAEKVAIRVSPAIQEDTIHAIVRPSSIPEGEVFRFVVKYSATTHRDLHIDLFDASTNFVAGGLQPVTAGSGIRDMTLSAPNAPAGEYFVTAFLTPRGQQWEQATAWSADQRIIVTPTAYQQWIEAHWGVLLWMDAAGPEDDPDRDGADNYTEFQTLTNPRDPADVLKASIEKSGSGWTVAWRSSPGRSYQLLQSASLNSGDWTAVGGVTVGTGALIEIEISPAHASTFYRIQAMSGASFQR